MERGDSENEIGRHNIAERLSAHQLLQVGSSGPIYVQPSPSTRGAEPPQMLPGGIGRIIGRSHLLQAMDDVGRAVLRRYAGLRERTSR